MTICKSIRRDVGVSALSLLAIAGTASAQLVDANAWRDSAYGRAQRLQWALQRDMPLEQNFFLVTHNSYNSGGYGLLHESGYGAPQHSYTITEQLDMGIRGFDFDIHEDNGTYKLAHGLCNGFGVIGVTRQMYLFLDEIAAWLAKPENADEVLFIYVEGWLDTNAGRSAVWDTFENYPGIGSKVVRLSELNVDNADGSPCDFGDIRPSDIRAHGRNILIADIGGSGGCSVDPGFFGSGFTQTKVTSVISQGPQSFTVATAEKSLFTLGDRLDVRGRDGGVRSGVVVDLDIPAAPNAMRVDRDVSGSGAVQDHDIITNNSRPNTRFNTTIFANYNGGYDCIGNSVWSYYHARDFDHNPSNQGVELNLQYWDSDTVGAERRNTELERHFAVVYGNSSISEHEKYGQINPRIMREAARAGVNQVRIDPLGISTAAGFVINSDVPGMLTNSVWSWDFNHLPSTGTPRPAQAAMAVLIDGEARIRAVSPSSVMRYATQTEAGEWVITDGSRTFAQALSEPYIFPFRVPGNGFEMQNLAGSMIRAGVTRVWVNYHDLNADGVWTSSTQKRKFYGSTGTAYPRASLSSYPVIVNDASSAVALNALNLQSIVNQHGSVAVFVSGASVPGPHRVQVPTRIFPGSPDAPGVLGR